VGAGDFGVAGVLSSGKRMSLVRAGIKFTVTAWTDGCGRCLYKGADAGPFNSLLITTGDDSLCAKP
jgi:hypothetical protein